MAESQQMLVSQDRHQQTLEEAVRLLTEIVAEIRGPPKAKCGNPAVVGLAGFGLTTMVLQFHNLGWMDSVGPVIWLGLIFGGLAQMIAGYQAWPLTHRENLTLFNQNSSKFLGLQEYGNGNNFGYSAFTTYGAFWISLALMLIANKLDFYPAFHHDIGLFLVAFTLYTLIMWIGTFCINVALCITFFLLFLGFFLLDVEHFGEDLLGVRRAAGWVLMACALGAWYCMAHALYIDVFKRNIVPVGPPPTRVILRLFKRLYG